MKKSRYSIYTTAKEQQELQAKYRGIEIPDAPPRSEWMTVDECFDDVINSVEGALRTGAYKRKTSD